jgi:hypothetical protein
MKTMKQSKIPKIKIPQQDLSSFGMDKLIIDPFWYDLYGIEPIEIEEEEEEEVIEES